MRLVKNTEGLEICGLAVRARRRGPLTLVGVDLHLPAGQVTGIVGPNGSGKSTLLKAVCGILPADSGQICLDGVDLLSLKQRQRAGYIGYVPQRADTPGSAMTVFQALALGADDRSPRHEIEQSVIAAAKFLDLTELLFRRVEELSGGQFQRVLIGRALVRNTPCMVLDEPVNNLDLHYQVEIMQLLRHLAHNCGKTIGVVLHDMNLAGTFCDRLAVVANGGIATAGDASEALSAELVVELFGDVADVSNFGRPWPGVLPKRK